jgi:hypothetical protein
MLGADYRRVRMTRRAREIDCAYCDARMVPTREHVLPAWIRERAAEHVVASPVRGRHAFGGELIVRDVCSTCNNDRLGRLDEAAKDWWEETRSGTTTMPMMQQPLLARWAAKISFNAQRATSQAGRAGQEPRMPALARAWMIGESEPDGTVLVVASLIPPDHHAADQFGTYGSNGTPLPRRYVHLGPTVFFVAWEHPQLAGTAEQVSRFDQERAPAAKISDPDGRDPLTLPFLSDPDVLLRGLRRMDEDFRRELLRRLNELEKQRGRGAGGR